MLLDGGALEGVRILSPLAVAKMTTPSTPVGERNVRGLGWDIDSAFSANRGELMPIGSFGHTGFTGTSSVDRSRRPRLFVVFLSNRVHPDGKGDVTPLRARVADGRGSVRDWPAAGGARRALRPGATSAVRRRWPARAARAVMTGIDVLRARGFAPLAGKRVGLITNHTGRARRTAQPPSTCCSGAKDVKLVALFSPEHGIRGVARREGPVVDATRRPACPIHSLYGETRRPTAAMLEGIDTLVFDIQDIGAASTPTRDDGVRAGGGGEARSIEVVVLDRPNPINGLQIEGPTLRQGAARASSATSRMPVRHGMTMGELARLFNDENKIGADLTVVADEELEARRVVRRDGAAVDEPVAQHAQPDPGDALSGRRCDRNDQPVGRSRHRHAFEQVGAPWIDGVRWPRR